MSETIEYKGYTITIEHDEQSDNPRDWDNLGVMVCWHRRYNLGDAHRYHSPNDFQEAIEAGEIDPAVMLPLYIYEHGGITMSTGGGRYPYNDPWDAGQVGWIYVSREAVRKEYSRKRISRKTLECARQVLECEVQTYDQFLTGDVYYYRIEDDDGNLIDAVGGLYGYEYALEEAKESADWHYQKTWHQLSLDVEE
jgi:hypothetical protein